MMLRRTAPPPNGVKLSWEQSTAPADVPVVLPANSPQEAAPKRTSLPSMLPPDCVAVAAWPAPAPASTGLGVRSEEHTSELQSRENLVCRLPLEKKKKSLGLA